MNIGITNDHRGLEVKQFLTEYLNELGYNVIDYGADSEEPADFPDYAKKMGLGIKENESELGIAICGTGIGISITANKMKGIRCALCSDCFSAEATRLHNDTNIVALGGRVVGPELAIKIVDTFLHTPFSGDERHARRISMIE